MTPAVVVDTLGPANGSHSQTPGRSSSPEKLAHQLILFGLLHLQMTAQQIATGLALSIVVKVRRTTRHCVGPRTSLHYARRSHTLYLHPRQLLPN